MSLVDYRVLRSHVMERDFVLIKEITIQMKPSYKNIEVLQRQFPYTFVHSKLENYFHHNLI